jgi:mannose-6-phosphate isomerase-like protein (cupin superfamily)
MTFLPVSIADPVVRASRTVTGLPGGPLGARFIVDGDPSGGRFSLVEHPIAPRGLAAPLHRHTREDEYSFILAGRWGFQLDGTVVHAEPGDLVYKPRGVWHAFWNATDEPARLLEIISPAGFERYFVDLDALLRRGGLDLAEVRALLDRYGVELDPDSLPRLVATHGLVVEV